MPKNQDMKKAQVMPAARRLKSKYLARQWRKQCSKKQKTTGGAREVVKMWWAALGCEVGRQLMLGHSLSMDYHRMLVQYNG